MSDGDGQTPPARKRGRGNGVNAEQIAARMADCEEAMITLRSSSAVERFLKQKYGASPATAQRYMAKVRAKWRDEASTHNRDARRDDMRQTLQVILRQALTRTIMLKDDEGSTIWRLNPDGTRVMQNGQPVPATRPNPDLSRALHCCKQLRALDSLDEPFTARLILDAELDAMPSFDDCDAATYEKIRDLVASVSPDGDVRKLAGDLFVGMSTKDADRPGTN